MITLESMMSIAKSDLPEASKAINKKEVSQLIEWLNLKDDSIRHQAFLILQNRLMPHKKVEIGNNIRRFV